MFNINIPNCPKEDGSCLYFGSNVTSGVFIVRQEGDQGKR